MTVGMFFVNNRMIVVVFMYMYHINFYMYLQNVIFEPLLNCTIVTKNKPYHIG